MGVYNNNKDGTRSTIANTIQVVDAPMEQFVSRGEFNAVVPSDTSADNKLVNDDKFDTKLNDIWKVQGEIGAKNLLVYPYSEVNITRAGISWSTDTDGTVYANGTSTSYSHMDLLTTYACKYKAGTYIFTLDENDNVGDIEMIIRNGNGNYGYVTKFPYRLTFTITDEDVEGFADGLWFNIRVYLNAGKTAENLKIHPMLRYASDIDDTWQPYTPTNRELAEHADDVAKDIWKVQGKLGAKNLLVYPYYDQSQVKDGITWTINDDTSITANGTATRYSYIDLEKGNFIPTTNEYIATIKNASWAAVGMVVILYDLIQKKDVWNIGMVSPTKITFTNEEIALINNGTYVVIVRVFVNPNVTVDNVTVYPMLRLASDTDDAWQPYAPTNYQLNRKVDAIAKGYLSGKSIMVIGDSLTATYQGTSWLKYLCDRVGATAINNATSGAYMAKVAYPDTTDTSVYAKVCESESSMYIDENDVNPDYIIVFAGTNDIRHGTLGTSGSDDVTTVYGALPHICEQLQTRFPNAHLGFITPYKATATQYNYQGFVDAIKSVCAEYSIPVFDNYTYGGVNFRNESVQAALTRGDGLHLNNKGWEYVSYKFEAFIRSL